MVQYGLLLLTVVSASITGQPRSTPASRPNVVLIIIDTLRADKLGCYGFPLNTSPELDGLARLGVRFKRVIAQCSWTKPSIGSMLTGRYPRSIGLYRDGPAEQLHGRYLTLAEILHSNGYCTFGLTANPAINAVLNFNQGFDHYVDSDVVWDWMMNLDVGKREYTPDVVPLPASDRVFAATVNSIRSLSKRPVYVQINVMEVHEGWRLVRPEFKNTLQGYESHWYLEAIRQVSYDIHRFVTSVLALPGFEHTLFVITSDHGQGLTDHPEVPNSNDHGYLLYESQLWVPLILFDSLGRLAPREVTQPVRLMDLAPTILEYLGIPVPGDMEGRSLLPLMTGCDTVDVALPGFIVAETNYRDCNKLALYQGEWKLFDNRDGQKGVNRYELQPMGKRENGRRTDQIGRHREIGRAMRMTLQAWERDHRRAESSMVVGETRRTELEQLRALGYLE